MVLKYMNSRLNFLPSAGWILFIVYPTLLQYRDLGPSNIEKYILIIISITIALLLSDWLSLKIVRQKALSHTGRAKPKTKSKAISYTIFITFCAIAICNLYLMPQVPIISIIRDSSEDITKLRDLATKGLDAPLILKYSFQWALVVIAPIGIGYCFYTKQRFLMGAFILIAIFYSLSTSAKLPFVHLLFLSVIIIVSIRKMEGAANRRTFQLFTTVILASLLIFSTILSVKKTDILRNSMMDKIAIANQELNDSDPRVTYTPGDLRRLMHTKGASLGIKELFTNKVDYFFYRVFLTPPDVSLRWYEYYSTQEKNPLGLESIISTRGGVKQSPSRTVGIWAYADRFPRQYTTHINAYASFDADSYARLGLLGVVLSTIILALTRIIAALFYSGSILSVICYSIILGDLFILPASASIQAIIGSQGLGIILFILFLDKLTQYHHSKPSKTVPTE